MGIKYLNHVFKSNCNDKSIYKVHLQQFAGKKIAVDASIFLYRFISEDKLIEQMYLMVSILRNYNILPIFVFDGPAPPEKLDVIHERKEKKRKAKEKYLEMKNLIENGGIDNEEKYETEVEMEKLKKQFIYIKDEDIFKIKMLLNNCGISWVVAHGEADEYCAHLMMTNQVYACLSEDMDLFAYGCCRILRHFSLVKHSVLFYDLAEILRQMGLNLREFRQIVVLSGTDYNKDNCAGLMETMKMFKEYKNHMLLAETDMSFYEWLLKNSDYIKDDAYLKHIYNMFIVYNKQIGFQTSNKMSMNGNLRIENGDVNRKPLAEMLGESGFVFA
jgi:5'-3' exonuclease